MHVHSIQPNVTCPDHARYLEAPHEEIVQPHSTNDEGKLKKQKPEKPQANKTHAERPRDDRNLKGRDAQSKSVTVAKCSSWWFFFKQATLVL